MHFFLLATALVALRSFTTASIIPNNNPTIPSVTYFPPTASPTNGVKRIFEVPGYLSENLAMRSNGQILTTTVYPHALLYYIDPLGIRAPILLQNFTTVTGTANGALGITELAHDVFYVVVSGPTPNNFVYEIDMRKFVALPDGSMHSPPVIKKIGQIAGAVGPNGMTHLRQTDDFVLIAETVLGGVWKFNVVTGRSSLIIQDPSMEGPPNKTQQAGYGINGVRTQNGTLFYTNSGAQEMWKMPLHPDGSSAGKAVLVTSGLSCDDFVLDPHGIAYVASPSNALIRVDTATGVQLIVGGTFDDTASDFIGGSSAQFGRGDSDRTSVYVTTNGASFTDAPAGSQGISRVDVSDIAQALQLCKDW